MADLGAIYGIHFQPNPEQLLGLWLNRRRANLIKASQVAQGIILVAGKPNRDWIEELSK